MPKNTLNKKLKFGISLLFGICLLFVFCILGFVKGAIAQDVLPLTVVPPKQEVLINPGEKFSTSVKFLNQGESPVTGSLSVLDFIVEDELGTPVFLENPQVIGTSQIPAKYSAAKWITVPGDSLTIDAKNNVSIAITINVPTSAAPGGRYAAIIFQPSGNLTMNNPESGQETPVAIRMASLIYIRVAGAISEKATLVKFEGPSFLEYGPISVTTQILNEGNYHIAPQGSVVLKDMFGRVVTTTKLDSKNIFPGTSRSYVSELGHRVMLGKFTATLTATYGETGQFLTSSLSLWVFPWKVAIAIALGAILIVLAFTVWYKKFKKKEEELVEELKEEKTELEALKEQLKDKIAGDVTPPKSEKPPEEKTP
jgi:hypothetical protein